MPKRALAQASGGKGATKAGKPGKGGQQGQQGAESSPTADSPTSAPATPSQPSEAPTEGKVLLPHVVRLLPHSTMPEAGPAGSSEAAACCLVPNPVSTWLQMHRTQVCADPASLSFCQVLPCAQSHVWSGLVAVHQLHAPACTSREVAVPAMVAAAWLV